MTGPRHYHDWPLPGPRPPAEAREEAWLEENADAIRGIADALAAMSGAPDPRRPGVSLCDLMAWIEGKSFGLAPGHMPAAARLADEWRRARWSSGLAGLAAVT